MSCIWLYITVTLVFTKAIVREFNQQVVVVTETKTKATGSSTFLISSKIPLVIEFSGFCDSFT